MTKSHYKQWYYYNFITLLILIITWLNHIINSDINYNLWLNHIINSDINYNLWLNHIINSDINYNSD